MREPAGADDASPPSTSGSHPRDPRAASRHSGHNIFRLLVQREVSPQTKYSSGNLRENTSKSAKGARHGLISWAEAESLGHLTAKYCPLSPPPRSTIAAAFSSDGNTLASTHGDHTVKIINCQTGNCSKVLSGHQRTPWVVRFHPLYPEILASGSLDHYVRLWNATTGDCIGSHDFYKPIASIAFHAQGELLAVASGRKLFMWHYKRSGENSAPTIVLKTRRSLRAVHFHPHAAPFLLTAEVNNLNSSDTSATTAAASNNLHYPPPIVYMSNANSNEHLTGFSLTSLPFLVWPPLARDGRRASSQHSIGSVDPSISVRLLTYSTPSGQYELLLSPIEPNGSSTTPEETGTVSLASEPQNMVTQSAMDVTGTNGLPPVGRSNQLFPFSDLACWELPFLHGWLLGQSQANQSTTHPMNGGLPENSNGHGEMENFVSLASLLTSVDQFRVPRRSRYHCSRSRFISTTKSLEDVSSNAVGLDESNPQPVSRFQSELATALAAAAAAAELPCTVRLRIWRHDVKEPSALLDAERCLLTIPHAVLCSEMGAHFSPCGRFLAACVACILPHLDGDPQFQSQATQDSTGPTSPTRHPNAAHQIVYELRVYSLEASTFGLVLASRAIRAAHCLTSIQFSPTSEHLLLAYGRRHSSLLKSVVIDRETTMPIYTILEVYKVSNMELLRVISSAEDEVNVACFHPSIGGGLVYGTKEGKLRILQNGGSCQFNGTATFVPIDGVIEDEMGPHPVCVFVNDDR